VARSKTRKYNLESSNILLPIGTRQERKSVYELAGLYLIVQLPEPQADLGGTRWCREDGHSIEGREAKALAVDRSRNCVLCSPRLLQATLGDYTCDGRFRLTRRRSYHKI
jgi:hypothetical protein